MQLEESQKATRDAAARCSAQADAEQARLRQALDDATLEAQQLSTATAKLELDASSAAEEVETLVEEVAQLRSSLESSAALCSTLEGQNTHLLAQVRT